jgi:hypothetical protein
MKKNSIIIVLSALLLGIVFCSKHEEVAPDHEPIIIKGVEGKSVFDLLLEHHEVDYKKSDMGVFINAIDGIENKGGHFWIYSVNGIRGKVSADKAIVSEGDTIEWRYE